MKLIFSLLFFFVATLQGEAPLPFAGDPHGIVFECVDAVSGTFGFVEEDFTVAGSDTLTLSRTWMNGWHFFPHTLLLLRDHAGQIEADTFEPDGMPLRFVAGRVAKLPAGYVNSRSCIGAATNVQNATFQNNILTAADGTQRHYAVSTVSEFGPLHSAMNFDAFLQQEKHLQVLQLQKEILPSGNLRVYSYDDAGKLSKVTLLNGVGQREFGSITFSYSKNRAVATGSNGAFAIYIYEFGRLVSVQRSEKADLTYAYENERLVQRNLPEGRFMKISYTKDGKVSALFTPASDDALYTFEYFPRETYVTDALHNKTLYRSRAGKLSCIEKYQNSKLFQSTRLFWGSGDEAHMLLGFAVFDKARYPREACRFMYDNSGNVICEQQFTGGDIQFDSDLLPCSGKNVAGTSYGFNDDPFHTLAKQVQPNGETIQLAYKPGTNLLVQAVVTPTTGAITRALYSYNSSAECIKEVFDRNGEGKLIETIVNPFMKMRSEKWFETMPRKEILLNRTKEIYDNKYNLIAFERYDRYGNFSYKKTYGYDAHQNIISVKDTDGNVVMSASYDLNDNILRAVSAIENCMTFKYDTSNRLIQRSKRFLQKRKVHETFEYDALGNMLAFKDTYGNVTKQSYDCLSRQVGSVSPSVLGLSGQRVTYNRDLSATVATFFEPPLIVRTNLPNTLPEFRSPYQDPGCEYDALWRATRVSRKIDDKTAIFDCKTYDLQGRIIESWIEQPDGSKLEHQFFTYDNASNLLQTSNDTAILETRSYQNNRLTSITDALGFVTTIEYNDACINAQGQTVLEKTVTNPDGCITKIQYDALHRETEKTVLDATFKVVTKEQFIYDSLNNVVAHDVTVLPSDILKPATVRHEKIYNLKNQLLSDTEAANSSYAKKTLYTYTKEGKVASIQYPKGQVKSFHYGSDGYLEKVLLDAKPFALIQCDDAGRIVQATTKEGVGTSRTYDSDGKIVSETVSFGSFSYTLGFTYDRLGRVKTVTLPDQSLIEYRYNGQLGFAIARLSSKGKELYVALRERLNQWGGIFAEKIEARDAMGRPVSINRNGERIQCSYDVLGRICRERAPRNVAYVYDSLNNMLKNGCGKFHYNILNQLQKGNGVSYRYDANGNLHSMITNWPEKKFSFDYDNDASLQSYEADGKSVKYLTDYFGRRIVRQEGGTLTYFLYIGETEVGSFDATGQLLDLKIPAGIEEGSAVGAAAVEIKQRPFFAISDFAGNIACLVDVATKQTAEYYSFATFGEESIFTPANARVDDSQIGNPWRFKGYRKDLTTGLIMWQKKDYITGVGRFTTPPYTKG